MHSYGHELDIMDGPDLVRDIFVFGDNPRDGGGLFVPRRHRGSGEES